MSATNIQIAVKIRPLIERELKEKTEALWEIQENSVVQVDYVQNCYSFDHIFDQHKTNKDVYDNVVNPLVISCLHGINSTIFAYGQTSSGKTHTILGSKNNPGIINYAIEDIFKYIEENLTKNFLLRCSYLEIYNEKINDLLDVDAKDIKIREDCYQGVHVAVKEEVIREKEELFILMKKGMKIRKIGCTDMNERSSRSHTIFKLIIQAQSKDSEGSYTESSLSLVDLAGSERVGQMNLKGERQAEGVLINKSLTTLGLVIRKLSENEQFINYRDSKLTRLLQHSLGGNSRTLIICTITPAALDETKSTLEFAQRAKYVKNRPVINEKVTDKDQLKQYARLCQDYKLQIDQLSLERLEKEKTINTLRDKIHNIELFSAVTLEKDLKINKALPRRHTMGHYRPLKSSSLKVSSGVSYTLDESSDEDDSHKQETTPSKTLRVQKELLEESYESLKCFTNYEKQFLSECDEIKELRDLANRLREENISLNQHIIKEREMKIKSMESHRDIYENLIFLKSVLEGNTPKGTPRKSLQTIIEEEQLDIFGDTSEVTEVQDWLRGITEDKIISRTEDIVIKDEGERVAIMEDNAKLKSQIEAIHNKLNEKELIEAHLNSKLSSLEKQIQEKDSCIESLKLSIKQEKDTKEVELDILNNRLKKLCDYKEEMHKKLSEIQVENEKCVDKKEYDLINFQHVELQMKHNDLEKEYKILQELNQSHLMQINKIQEMHKDLEIQVETLKLNSELLDEAKKEISDLKQVVKTEAEAAVSYEDELLKLKSEYSEMQQNQHIIDQRNSELLKQLEEAAAENSTLQSKLALHENIISDFEDMKVQNNNYKIMIDELHKGMNKLKENITVSTTNFCNQQSLNLELQAKMSEYVTEITNLKEDAIELKNVKECLNKKTIEHDNLLKSLESILSEKQEIQEKYHNLENEKENLNKDFIEMKTLKDNKNQENLNLLQELNNMKEFALEFEQKEKCYKQNVIRLENKMSSLESLNEQRLINLNEKIKGLEEQNSNLNQQIAAMTEEVETSKSTIILLREKLEEIQELNTALEDQNRNILEEKKNIELRKQEYDKVKNEITDLYDEIKMVKDNFSKADTDCKFYIESNKDLQNQLSELTNKLQNLTSDLTESKAELEKINMEKDNIEKENYRLIEENEEINDVQQFQDKLIELGLLEENKKLDQILATKNDECDEYSELNKDLDKVSQLLCKVSSMTDETCDINNLKVSSMTDETCDLNLNNLEVELDEALNNISLAKDKLKKIEDLKLSLDQQECNLFRDFKVLTEIIETTNQKAREDQHMFDIQLNDETLRLQKENSWKESCLQKENSLKECLDSITADFNILSIENLQLRGQLSELQVQISIMKSDSSELKITKDHLTQLNNDYKSLQASIKSLEEQKEAVQELNKCLEGEITEKVTKLEEQSNELQILSKDNDKLKLELIELTQKYDAINNDYNNKTEELNSVVSTTNDLKVENMELKDQNSSLHYEVNSLKAEITELVNAADASDMKSTENTMLKESLLTMEEEKLKLEQSYKELEEEKAGMLERLLKLQNDIDERDSEIIKYNEEISKLNKSLKVETTEMFKLREQNEKLNNVLQSSDSKDMQIVELTQQIKTLTDDYESRVKSLNDKALMLQCKVDDLEEAIRLKTLEFSELIDVKNKEVLKLTEQSSNLTNHYESKTNELNKIISTKQNIISKLEESLALQDKDYTNLIQNKDLEILCLNTELKKYSDYEYKNKEWLRLSAAEKSSTSVECGKKEKLIHDLQNQIRSLETDQKQLNKLLGKNTKQLIDKNVAIANLKAEVDKIIKEKTDLEAQYNHLLKEYSSLQEKSKKNQDYFKKIQNEETALELKVDEQNRLLTGFEKLEQNLEEKENRSKNLENDFDKKPKNIGSDDSLRKNIADNVLKEKHIARLSDESRPLSPNEIRRIKRQSLHDQRRGLDFSSSESLEYANSDCAFSEDDVRPSSVNDQDRDRSKSKECVYCKTLQCLVDKIREEKEMLSKELNSVTEKNVALDEENEDMLKVIRELELKQYELFEELQSYIGSDDGKKTNQADLLRKKEELESELLKKEKIISGCKDKIVDLECDILQSGHKHESIERDLRTKISELQCKIRKSPLSVADKQTQAECDLNEKYKHMKALAILRKEEGNYLRAQLNLPPNCPVLPKDVQSNLKKPQ
ncbi:uncharacterized protein LOC143196882 [Rhynchophorus ferrugineus]|uniref:uncharacterized protein LOC143196882 n=1 Tax=Rhynchophorus ferrugineus TaxID=354439 RepID=UPI003FCCC86D